MARDGSFGGGGGRVDALLPNPTILLETTLIYFLVSKIIPWVKGDLSDLISVFSFEHQPP